MRPPPPAHHGMLGQHHGLTRLPIALETIAASQRQQETRDTAIQTHLPTQGALLTQARRWGRSQRWAIAGLGLLTLVRCGLVVWQVWHPPLSAYARALGSIDAVLVQPWGSLPKPIQASRTLIYGRRGWTSPGARQGRRP